MNQTADRTTAERRRGSAILLGTISSQMNRNIKTGTRKDDPERAVIFFYFKGDDVYKRDAINMLRSAIKQLFEKSDEKSVPLRYFTNDRVLRKLFPKISS